MLHRSFYLAALWGLVAHGALARDAGTADDQAHAAWRAALAKVPVPQDGCYHAAYPSLTWVKTACVTAPNMPFAPRAVNNYGVAVTGILSDVIGSFPSATGLTGKSEAYSLQLNSSLITTPACDGRAGCQGWQQFIYSASVGSAFIQYWLIGYGDACPSGWQSSDGDCYRNSAAAVVPAEPITSLPSLKLSGATVVGGNDTLTMLVGNEAYTTSASDSVLDLGKVWNGADFNIVSDGDAPRATATLTVKDEVEQTDGSTAAPRCVPESSAPRDRRHLKLGQCKAYSGSPPYIEFVESYAG